MVVAAVVVGVVVVARMVRSSLKSLQIRRVDQFHVEECAQVIATGMMMTKTTTMMLTVMKLTGRRR